MRRRRKRQKSSSVRDPEFCYPDNQEIGVADCSDGKEQLDDTQVVTPVHELRSGGQKKRRKSLSQYST